MIKKAALVGLLLLSTTLVGLVSPQVQLFSITIGNNSLIISQNVTSKNNTIEILGIDSTAFPKLKANVVVDKFCALAGNLRKENFKVHEDGKDAAIDNFYFTGNASGHKLDLAVVFDDTRSMQPEIDAMKSKVVDLTNTIKTSGLEANYSLVPFEDSVSVKPKWTADPEIFKKNVEKLYANGGGDEPEDALDAIEAALSMGFRPNAQKVILVITDAHAHYKNDSSGFSKYTKDQVEKDLKGAGVIFIPVSPAFQKPTGYVDLRGVANDTQSIWIDVKSANFSAILEQFKGIITGNYMVEYTSPNETAIGNRNVTITVDAPGCAKGLVSSFYTRPDDANSPPVVDDLVATQDKSTDITWTANATDPDGDQILYKFFLNNKSMTDWIYSNKWILNVTHTNVGNNTMEVRIRDGKHKAPDGCDYTKSVQFNLTSMRLMVQKWERTFGTGEAYSVQQTSDGGYVLTGKTWDINSGLTSALLIKTDANGDMLWKKTFGVWQDEYGYSVQQTSDGGYILAGDTVLSGSGGADIWLIKTDSLGNKEWDSTFSGGQKGPVSVQQTSDGGFILVGTKRPFGSDDAEYENQPCPVPCLTGILWLIKIDPNGNKVWDKTYGGSGGDHGKSIQQTSEGGYIITGERFDLNDLKNLKGDVLLIKTDSQGNEEWGKTFGGSGFNIGISVQQINDGGFIIGSMKGKFLIGFNGPYFPPGTEGGIWLINTDMNGNEVWNKTFRGIIDSSSDRPVQQTSNVGYIITGKEDGDTMPNAILIKTNSFGNKEWNSSTRGRIYHSVWNRTFTQPAHNWGNSIQQTNDGGYIVAGVSKAPVGAEGGADPTYQ